MVQYLPGYSYIVGENFSRVVCQGQSRRPHPMSGEAMDEAVRNPSSPYNLIREQNERLYRKFQKPPGFQDY